MTFRDGTPENRFNIVNADGCATAPMDVAFDLSGSPSNLIFNVMARGADVAVFSAVRVGVGGRACARSAWGDDGDTVITLQLGAVPAGGDGAFRFDLDDTIGARDITVGRSQIEGTAVWVLRNGDTGAGRGAVFDDQGRAVIAMPACTG